MQLIETLLLKNHQIQNANNHIKRVKRSFEYFKWKFDKSEWENLKFEQKEARIRITYNQKGIVLIETFPLQKRNFEKFKVVEINFNYFLKKKNRDNFLKIHQKFPGFDEYILVKNSLITDTTISNLAFFDGKEWLTPKHPLLKGTQREKLIQEGKIKETNIHKSDLKYFKKIALLNAILGFKEIENFDIIF